MNAPNTRILSALTPALLATLLAACGGAPVQKAAVPEAPVNEAAATAAEDMPQAEESRVGQADDAEKAEAAEHAAVARGIPSECASSSSAVCTPPTAFAETVCKQVSPTVALAMFQKKMPWTRAYMRVDTEAWYTKSRRADRKQLKFGEELIVLEHRSGGTEGVQVSGSGSYDVYRWDGTCASVMADEVTLQRPMFPQTANIRWRELKDETRDVLEKNRKIKFRLDMSRKRCEKDSRAKGCVKARDLLSSMIADHVRGGGEVPAPDQFAW